MKSNGFIMLVIVFLACSCGSAGPTTPTPTPLPPVDPDYLHFDPIPEQVAYQGETFLPLDLKGFLFYHDAPLAESPMTWTAVGGGHLTATIEDGWLSVKTTPRNWYGDEDVRVLACDDQEVCIEQHVAYSRVEESAANHVRVIYVGNSGFLIMTGGKKVLIDGMYSSNSQAVRDLFASGTPPFDNIDVILASHDHGDHFDPVQVQAYLQTNTNTMFVSTAKSVAKLDGFPERTIAMDPALSGSPVTGEVDGVNIEAYYLSHGSPPAGQQEDYNNGYLVTVGDLTFFHCGDIDGLYNMLSYNLDERDIDLAFIVHFYMRSARDRGELQNGIAAKYYFPIHYEGTTPPFSASVTRNVFPDAVIFNSVLQSWIMP